MSDDLSTRLVHAIGPEPQFGGVHAPVHPPCNTPTATLQDLIAVFQGKARGAFNYARQGTPTTAALEGLVTELEGGIGTVSFATGMAALSAIFLTLLKAGDHLVTSSRVFGNTNSFFGTLQDLGVAVTKVDAGNVVAVEAALRPETRMVFVETIANPSTRIPDLAGIGALCQARGLLSMWWTTPSPHRRCCSPSALAPAW